MKAAKKLYDITGPHESVLQQLQELRASDKGAEESVAAHNKEQTKGCSMAGGGCLTMMLTGAIAQQGVFDNWPEWAWKWVLAVCMVIIPVGLIKSMASSSSANAASKFDLDDDRYESLERLHRFFSTDCHSAATFSYGLELRNLDSPEFLQKEDKFGGLFSYPKGSTRFYEIPLLSGRMKLKNGIVLQLKATRFLRVKAYNKKSASGKIKSKRKVKWKDLYQIDLKLPGETAETNSPLAPAPTLASLVSNSPQWKQQGNKIRTSVKVAPGTNPFSVEPLLQLGLWTFRRLQPNTPST